MESFDWHFINQLESNDLKNTVFSIMQKTAFALQASETDDPTVLSVIPRLAEILKNNDSLYTYQEPFSALARSVGLWNYINKDVADLRDLLIAEAVFVQELGITLHKEQVAVLNSMLSGRNLILSAPTSFGKSLLIDALLLTGRYNKVAIVLPTIALLDEFRRRLAGRFEDEYEIIMYSSEVVSKDKVIFLGTQERLISRSDIKQLDLLVVDEFYKLDTRTKNGKRDERSLTLNATVYKLLKKARQFFFLGPNIDQIYLNDKSPWRFEFLKTKFSTVAVDTYDLQAVEDKSARLKEEAFKEANWPVLIFVSSPGRANDIALELAREKKIPGFRSGMSAWIQKNYGGKWELSECVASGIGVHHGRIPRSLSSRFVKLFNDGVLPVMICTSTLIEGVNTAARSVIIYDKKIDKDDFDFFTFSNIKGRAGRLGQYYTGNVYLFNEQPNAVDVGVVAPVFDDYRKAPDELAVHLEDSDKTDYTLGRLFSLTKELQIDIDDLKRISMLGTDNLRLLKQIVSERLLEDNSLVWSGRPDWEHIVEACTIICEIKKVRDFGVKSPRQLAMYINKLRRKGSIADFFKWYSDTYAGNIGDVDKIFKFLRSCEHSLPQFFDALQVFVRSSGFTVNYDLFLSELPRWFRPDIIKQLEEQGVPMQVSERFMMGDDTLKTLRRRLVDLSRNLDPSLSKLEQAWILDAIPA